MIRACSFAGRCSTIVLLAVLAGAGCNDMESPLASDGTPSSPTDETGTTLGDSLTSIDTLTPTLVSVSYSGLPYGPTSLWKTLTTFEMGPEPFTLSQELVTAGSVIARINNARSRRQRLVLAMTGGSANDYKTNGRFDLSKWKRRMNSFKTSAIRNAVAAGVSDGTVLGNVMMDEPETPKWGGNISKGLLDDMAAYAKGIFPTLPMGVNIGPPAYRWRASERFHKVDWVRYQYSWWVTSGNVGAWRSVVLDQARKDGVTPAFSMNLLNGGTKDKRGSWNCPQSGRGTYRPNCRMAPDQVREYGRAIGPSGCFMLMWRYDDAFMSRSGNRDAFRSVASLLASKSRRSCRRS